MEAIKKQAIKLREQVAKQQQFLCTIFLYSNSVARKLAEDCCKYGAENQSDNSCVARAALQFGTSHDLMENERETLLGILRDQVLSRRSTGGLITEHLWKMSTPELIVMTNISNMKFGKPRQAEVFKAPIKDRGNHDISGKRVLWSFEMQKQD
ncbi:hypothetical protein CUMW_202010 [Citrus unshiu]|nr:hypothetical protein CUMW_202010 [Citrus unshiu]